MGENHIVKQDKKRHVRHALKKREHTKRQAKLGAKTRLFFASEMTSSVTQDNLLISQLFPLDQYGTSMGLTMDLSYILESIVEFQGSKLLQFLLAKNLRYVSSKFATNRVDIRLVLELYMYTV